MSKLKTVAVTTTMGESAMITADIRGHKVVIDQPHAAGGTDEGPTPLEYFLFSLAGCIQSIARIAATQQKLALRHMEVSVKADLNPMGLMGKETDDRVGFQTIDVSVTMDADLSEAEKVAFLDEVCERCPLHDNIRLNTSVSHAMA